jgi:tRNA threonylcarbamoyladenosine biosynthesis protein TsaE
MHSVSIKNLNEMQDFAIALARDLKMGSILCLKGDLGAGKTTLAGFIINALLERAEPEIITSPTFTLVHTYDSPKGTIWHFDLYRLKALEEVYELGIEEAFTHGISIIEWPEIAHTITPHNALWLTIEHGDETEDSRKIIMGS